MRNPLHPFITLLSKRPMLPRLVAVGLLWALLINLATANTVVIDLEHDSLNITPYLLLLEDPEDDLDLQRAIQAAADARFTPVTDEHLQLGYSHSAYWLHVKLHNGLLAHTADNLEDRFYLSIDYPLLDNVEFYHLRDGQVHSLVTGDRYLFKQRYFNLNGFVFPLALRPGETGDLYIRVYTSSSFFIPVTVQTEQAFINERFHIDTLDGIYIGITIGLGIYNLFLWIGIRNRVYGYYVLLVFNIMLVNTSITGLTFRFWPSGLVFQQLSVYFFSFTTGVMVLLFGMAYLKTRKSQPQLHRLFQALVGICLLCIPLLFYMPIMWAAKLTAGMSFFVASVLIVAAIRLVLRGYRPAIYYTLGQGAVIVSVLFTSLTSQKILPMYHIAPEVMKWCSAFELILFSIGLADMVNNERRLREQAQQDSAEAQQKLLDGQIQLNHQLDELVTQRTQALETANNRLRELNTRDDLTGLRNRRYLNETLPAEYKRAYREKSPLSVLMLDIDYFKQLNDTYGHQFGDHCLTETGRLLLDATRRPPDIAVRYGGEEFVLVLPNTDLSGALVVAEKIRRTVEVTPIHHGEQSAQITISIGVASETPTSRDEQESLLRMADDLLYQAKSKGRNRVESAGQANTSQHLA